MRTKHTKGVWNNTLTGIKSDRGLLVAQCWYGSSNDSFGRIPAVPSFEEHCANSKLIAAAPEMFRHACINYLRLLAHMPNILRNTMDGQEILNNALTPIQIATGIDRQELQDYFEDLSVRVKFNRINIKEAILLAIE